MNKESVNCNTIKAFIDFSVRLFQNTFTPRRNVLISPTSLLAVLTMAVLGAKGFTQTEIEMVIGAGAEDILSVLNVMLTTDSDKQLSNSDTVKCANAIWLCDDGRVQFKECYLDKCKESSQAQIFKALFDDETLRAINRWVKEKTDGEITEVLKAMPQDVGMIMMNTLAFNNRWEKPYKPSAVKEHIFTTEGGEKQKADFMQSTEKQCLLDDEARGVIKEYRGGRYAFAALVPDKGVSLGEYIAQLTGERLLSIIQSPIDRKVETLLPKFEVEQELDLKETLMKLGINDAFDRKEADFSDIGTPADPADNLYISDVQQKNKIRVNEEGTKAVSVTGIDTLCLSSCVEPKFYKVYLDRPFLYMIIDQKTNLPLFMGTITSLQNAK